ncbi:MAG: amidase [Rhizobiaceae bacterium]|nr:amidase [Rhizobiaceae bacterium]
MPTDPFNAFLDGPQVPVKNAKSGPLAGLSLGVKDIFDVAGYVSGWGNPVRAAEAGAAEVSAPAVQALLDAGARFAGKTQTEELAFSMVGQNVHFPHPVNPAAPDRITGGSSSGSAAAVAGGLADIATGSDTGGSIRAPAGFCGLIGLRTTFGAISLDGTMPLAPSFDTFGWFARDGELYEKVGHVLLPVPGRPLRRPRLLRSALLDELPFGPAELDEYGRMAGLVGERFGSARPAGTPPYSIDELYWCTRKLQAHEAWAAHGAWIESADRRLGKATFDRFAFGRTVTDQDVKDETARRTVFRRWLGDLLADDGILVLPTTPCAAPRSDSTPEEFGAFRERAIRMLCWSGLSGFPQITVPLGAVDGAPFGISLLGPAGSDLALIAKARELLESSTT